MAKIYTKTGDTGQTSLVSGTRVSKGEDRIQLYGDVDELNSHIGYFLSICDDKDSKKILVKIQSSLFDLGSNLACEESNRDKYKLPQIRESLIQLLESEIDRMDKKLSPLKNFILPGGNPGASYAHICRTVSRRVEVDLVRYTEESKEKAPENAIKLLNRLSDYFFVLSRYINLNSSVEEIIWQPN